MKRTERRLTRVFLILSLTSLLLISQIHCFNWPWESAEEDTPTVDEILEKHGVEIEEPKESITDRFKSWTGQDTKKSKEQGSFFDKFRFYEKEKQDQKATIMKAKLLSALDVNAEEIAKHRDFMNNQVDTNPKFENLDKAMEQIKDLLIPVRRFRELDEGHISTNTFFDYNRTYMRRLTVMLDRLFDKRDDLKLQMSIIETNMEHFCNPHFHFGEFYAQSKNSRRVFEVINANKDPRLAKYYPHLQTMKYDFGTRVKEIRELRKEGDANLQMFFDSLRDIMVQVNTQKQFFFETFSEEDGDAEKEKKDIILEKIKDFMKNVVDRRERILDSVNQISFILNEMKGFSGPVRTMYKEAKPTVELMLVEIRQFGRGKHIHAEEYFKKKDEEARNKFLRDKVVSDIEDKNTKVEDIENPDIGRAVLTSQEQDPKNEEDPFLHLRTKKTIEGVVKDQEKQKQDEFDGMKSEDKAENKEVKTYL